MVKSSTEDDVPIPAKKDVKQDSFHLLAGEAVLLSNGQHDMDKIIVIFRRITFTRRHGHILPLMVLDQAVQQLVPPPPHSLGFGTDHLAEHPEASQEREELLDVETGQQRRGVLDELP